MKTAMDVKKVLDPELYVNMVNELQSKKPAQERQKRLREKDDMDLFVAIIAEAQKTDAYRAVKKRSNVIPFPGTYQGSGKRTRCVK